ncbi:unnamed protein product [Wuchereria bancrofti]|uniref:Uncharacterized protein n=1 Tax=Wuchereria bancrofti TaxID=6293 RepID=A0A3P7DJN9_WUCBA|nr:unnamed protein product [Wuchereria bancrofti]
MLRRDLDLYELRRDPDLYLGLRLLLDNSLSKSKPTGDRGREREREPRRRRRLTGNNERDTTFLRGVRERLFRPRERDRERRYGICY